MLFYQGFAVAIVSVAAPWIGTSFHLDGAGIARLFAWISLSALGALALSRMIDRYGRRRMILGCMTAIPVCSIGSAISTSLTWFAHIPDRTLRGRRRGRLRLRRDALRGAADRASRSRPKLRRPRRRGRRRVLRLPHPDFRGLRMVVAMDVRALGGRRRDAAGDGAAVARERAMGSFRRVGHHDQDSLLRRLSAALSQALDHDDRLRARRRNLDHRRQRLRLLPRRFGGRPVGRSHQHDDHRRRRTRTARLPARRMERGAIRPRADGRRLRHRNHRRTPVVLLGTAVAFRVAADVAGDRDFSGSTYATTAAPSPATRQQPNCSRLRCAAR